MGAFDGNFKRTAIRDIRTVLHLMGALDDKANATVRPVKSDLSVPSTSPDEIVVINDRHGERIEVLEEITWRDRRDERKIVRRAASLSLIPEYEPMPISVRVMLMRPDKVPAQLTEQMLFDRRGAKLTVEPVFIRTWEIPPISAGIRQWCGFRCRSLLPSNNCWPRRTW